MSHDFTGAGTPPTGGYSQPIPYDRTPNTPDGMRGPDDGRGTKRNRTIGITAVVVLTVVIVVAFVTSQGHAVRGGAGVTVAQGEGKVLPPTKAQGWSLSYKRGSGTYRISGLRPGDTFTSTIVLSAEGKESETFATITTSEAVGTIAAIEPGYATDGTLPSGAGLPDTAAVAANRAVTAYVQRHLTTCSDPTTGSDTTLEHVTVTWSGPKQSGTTKLILPYFIELAQPPVCS